MSDYNGWTNWETWESFNILSNDEYLEREATKWRGSPKRLEVMVKEWLLETGSSEDHIDFSEVNFQELEDAFNE